MSSVDFESVVSGAEFELRQKHGKLIDGNDSIQGQLDNSLGEWKGAAKSSLADDYPYTDVEAELSKWSLTSPSVEDYKAERIIRSFEKFCRDNNQSFDRGFWEKKLSASTDLANSKALKEAETAHKLLLQQWQKLLNKATSNWELSKLAELRKELMKKLEEWLKLLESLTDSLESLGLDPGIWLDLSSGSLDDRDIEEFRRWAEFLAKDSGARRIAELLGKMRQISSSERIERVKHSITTQVPVVDISSKEEIVGIRLGKDIEHALPSELALLSDPESSILFDLKYLESRLLCFEMQGETLESTEEEIEREQAIEEQDKLGPMILCVDTSGSMHGIPEAIAKAMALFLSSKAKEQNRPCYLINFSTGISTFELTGSEGLGSLMRFLSQSFHGGTDVAPALRHALEVMEKEDYQKSDVLVLSDFIMGRLPSDVLSGIEKQRKADNRFNSLVIGNEFLSDHMDTYFDREWVYNPHTSLIHELVNFRESVLDNNKQVA
ncbi:MAG: hypothetical protein CL693_03975 [Cellvibrionaceae bacterium]|nr:hypothetical protein [Cellvibrionaceae bacterium]|tara:strand:- start:5762 stop:7246 length:1485 start_codon:yes stop_codon:yes gene_type:complete